VTDGLLLFELPLLLVTAAVVAWFVGSRSALPPRFTGYSLRNQWSVDPVAALQLDLRDDRLTSAILMVRARLLYEIAQRANAGTYGTLLRTGPKNPSLRRAWGVVRRLEATYRIAARYEDPELTDPWSRWRRRSWRATARRRFDRLLEESGSVWSSPSPPSEVRP
jgi:hypothetical protein